jgi:DDE superfamily endonuclease
MNFFLQKTKIVGGVPIGHFIIGDPAYPQQNWLLKGFIATRDPAEDSFNVYLNKARVRVENAFGRLKARWRILNKRIDLHYEQAPRVILGCFILHNIVEAKKQQFNDAWFEEATDSKLEQPRLSFAAYYYDNLKSSATAAQMQNALKDYLKHNFPLLQSIKRSI